MGARYSLHAEAIEAASGRTLFAASASATDREALLPALEELTRQVRSGLGDSCRERRFGFNFSTVNCNQILQALLDDTLEDLPSRLPLIGFNRA